MKPFMISSPTSLANHCLEVCLNPYSDLSNLQTLLMERKNFGNRHVNFIQSNLCAEMLYLHPNSNKSHTLLAAISNDAPNISHFYDWRKILFKFNSPLLIVTFSHKSSLVSLPTTIIL